MYLFARQKQKHRPREQMYGHQGGKGRQVYIQLIHFIVQQKLTQHCKAVILQLKKEKEIKTDLKKKMKKEKKGEDSNQQNQK